MSGRIEAVDMHEPWRIKSEQCISSNLVVKGHIMLKLGGG